MRAAAKGGVSAVKTPELRPIFTKRPAAGGFHLNPGLGPRYLLKGEGAEKGAKLVCFRVDAKAEAEDVALVGRLRARLGKEKGDQLSDADARYLVNALRRAPSIGARTVELLLHLAELATLEKPERWQEIFDTLKKKCDLDAHLPPEKVVTALHRIADSLSMYRKLDSDAVTKLLALGTVRGIPTIPERRALETVRRLHPMTVEASKTFATRLRDIPLAEPKPWTFLFYMASENDLEPFAIKDVNDMERAFGDIAKIANVVVLADGGVVSKEDEDLGPAPERNWSGKSRLLLISEDEGPGDGAIVSRTIPVPEDTDLGALLKKGRGELNLGKGETLKAVVDFVQNGVPSDHFFFSVWSHGLAWKGIAEDNERGRSDLIRPHEMAEALSDLKQPIDVMGFDACLMANSGVAMLLSKLGVKYMIGSEELLDATGWGYEKVFRGFADRTEGDGKLTPESLAHTLVDVASGTTLSAVRLDDAGAIWSKLDALGEALLAAGGRANEEIQTLIAELPRYGSFGVDASEEDQALGDENVVDVIYLCKRLEETFGADSDIGKAATALRETTEAATHYKNEASESYPGIEDRSYGLTTYLPRTGEEFATHYLGRGAVWKDAAPKWIELLKQKA